MLGTTIKFAAYGINFQLHFYCSLKVSLCIIILTTLNMVHDLHKVTQQNQQSAFPEKEKKERKKKKKKTWYMFGWQIASLNEEKNHETEQRMAGD